MTSLHVLIVFFSALLVMELVLLLRSTVREADVFDRLLSERTRNCFADIRCRLVDLAMTGKIDSHSATFTSLHAMSTFIMRRPDQYDEISSRLTMHMLFCRGQADPAISAERAAWTPEVKELVREVAQGLNLLLLHHSRILRALVTLERWTGAVSTTLAVARFAVKALTFVVRLATSVLIAIYKRYADPELVTIEKSRDTLLAAAA